MIANPNLKIFMLSFWIFAVGASFFFSHMDISYFHQSGVDVARGPKRLISAAFGGGEVRVWICKDV